MTKKMSLSARECSFAIAVLATMVALVCPAQATDPEPRVPEAFRVEAAVRVGTDGRVESVTPEPALNPMLVESLTTAVKRLRFEPLELEGRLVPGDTHIRMRGCAMPAEAGLQVVYEFVGTGPGIGRAAPHYPPAAAQAGVSAIFDVVYRIEPDGSGIVESIESDRSSRVDRTVAGRRIARMFNASITQWVESRMYVPEALDGHAVATRIQRRVEFLAPGDASRRYRAGAAAESASLCGLAREGAPLESGDIAIDTPFVLVPDA